MSSLLIPLRAQEDEFEGRREQLDAFRVAFYTQRLALTSEEAQRFWPVYNAYNAELETLRTESRQKQVQMRQLLAGSSSDAEIEKLADDYLRLRQREYQIAEKYHSSFKRVLPVRKVVLLYRAEQDFKKELLAEIQRRREQNINNRPGVRPGIRN
ncbi:MAG: hypothetical protein OHK0039_06560 [Bacteroidia bacterium]